MTDLDGVTKFQANHVDDATALAPHDEVLGTLLAWRVLLFDIGGIGRDPERYDGAGYGNMSLRVPPFDVRGDRPFVVTGTQTGGTRLLTREDLCLVTQALPHENRVTSTGSAAPSSESMTHAAIYGGVSAARAVIHVHAPPIFRHAATLGLAEIAASVAYGTVEMATQTASLVEDLNMPAAFVMRGHIDGVVIWGASLDAAATFALHLYSRAYALDAG